MKIVFAGDVHYMNDTFTSTIITDEVKNKIQGTDLFVYNLEGPILPNNGSYKPIIKRGPTINQGNAVIQAMRIDNIPQCVTLANNHMMDYGEIGVKNTIELLNNEGIGYIGIRRKNELIKPYILETQHTKVAIFSVAENGFGCIDEPDAEIGYEYMLHQMLLTEIASLSDNNVKVIVICHAGAEEFETPLPEIRAIYKSYIDVGASAVIAHHPHVCQGMELYNDCPIFYSLGNFAFDKSDNSEEAYNPEGMLVSITINDGGKLEWEIIPTLYINKKIVVRDIKDFNKWIDERNALLEDEQKYLEEVNAFCENALKNYYGDYYDVSRGLYLRSLRSFIITIIRLLINRRKCDELMLYHNIIIDTHRWIVIRAIHNKMLNEI